MAKISTYNLDNSISVNDLVLGSSYEGSLNGNPIYNTRNYRLSDLAQFFQNYDFSNDISLSEVEGRVTALENAGIDLTAFSVSTNSPGTAALSYNNLTGQFTYTPPDLSPYLTSVSIGFSDLTSTPTTIAGYGITDAFDGSYTSLTNVPTSFPPSSHNHDTLYAPLSHNHDTLYAPISHNHDDRYYTETEVDSLLTGYLSTSTNLGDLSNVSSASPSTGQVLKWNGTAWAPGTDLQASGGTGISLTDLSVSVATAGTANLSYDNTSGTFTYTPPDLTSYIGLTGLSVTTASSSGGGSLSYDNTTGVFTYTPPDFSGSYLPTSGGTITGDLTIQGLLTVNGTGTSNFADDVSVDGDLSVDGALTVGTLTGDIRGDVYSIVGATSSVKVLESGSGSTPDTYYIGDLRNNQTDIVFDTSAATFQKDVSIGVNTTSTNNLNMHGASKIWFDEGISLQETYIDKTKINNWDYSVLTSSKFQMGQTTGTPQEDLIQFNINGSGGLTSTYSIKPGTYLSASTDTDTHVLLDVNTTTLDDRYVDIGGDTMTGNLSFDAENKGVVGNILNTNGTKILENGSSTQTAYLVGNVAGDIIQSDLSTVIFDSSEDAFTRGINIGVPGTNNIITDNFDIDLGVTSEIYFGRGITSGTDQEQYVSGAKISQWDAANEKHITNMEFQEGSGAYAGKFELYITAEDSQQNRTSEWLIEEGSNITMSITERVTNSGQGAINISAKLATATTDGLITKSQLSNFGVSSLTAGGTLLNGAIEVLGSNGISISGDGTDLQISIAADNATTSNVGVVQLATVAQAEDLTNNNTSDNVITLQTLDAALGQEITIPTLQQVTNSGDETNHDIHIVGSQQEMLLTRVTTNTGNNNIATFDTLSSQGYIQVGSQISSAQDYGYIGHSSSGLHLSKFSGTGSGIVIDSSDNVSMGGNLSVSGTLTTTGVASLDGGISVDTNFSVDGTNGNVYTAGTLSSGNTSITGTLTVSGASTLQGAVTANSLTVTNNSTLNTVSLGGDLTPSVDSSKSLGTSGLRFLNVYTDNLNGVNPDNFANKGTSNVQTFTANVVAPDFQLTSDERLKENIIDLKPRKINVDFKEYNFKDTKQTRFGVVAQEVEKHHPEFIKESDSGYKSVSYIDLLVAKIVELEDRIKQLENG